MDQKNKPDNNQAVIDVNLDTTPILYTDNVFMTSNEYGVTLDVAQKLGPTRKMRVVSRVGMSREHAKKLVNELGKLLAMTEGQKQTGDTN